MRFHRSEEQLAIQAALRGMLAKVLPPERLARLIDEDADFDERSWTELMLLGFGGIALPEEDGGGGLGLVDLAMAVEMTGAAAAPGPLIEHAVASMALARSGKQGALLRRLALGEEVATLAWGGGWLPSSWTVEVEDNAATGSVRFVVGARVARHYLVGTRGGGLIWVKAGAGVDVVPLRSSDRTRALSTVTFSSARCTEVFEAGDARVNGLFDAALVLIAADALGGAQRLTDQAVAYAKEREQFGQPIGRFQALKHQLAEMSLEVEPARALVWYAAYAQDVGLDDAARLAALVKAHLADRYGSVARTAIAVHGGLGYTWDALIHVWFRRAAFDRAWFGSPALHRDRAADMADW